MSKQISGIYRILNKINGKGYVGSAICLGKRLPEHKWTLRTNKHKNPHLQAAYNLYGEENFSFEIIEKVSDISKLLEREQYWIDFYDSADPEKGYNICKVAGNTLGRKHSEETKQRMRGPRLNFSGENNPFFGKHHTKETNEKNRKAHLGKQPGNKGKPLSQEQKNILREAALKRWQNPEYREHMSDVKKGSIPWNKGIPATPEKAEILRKARLGQPSWNKGLTKEIDSRLIQISEKIKKTLKEKSKGD